MRTRGRTAAGIALIAATMCAFAARPGSTRTPNKTPIIQPVERTASRPVASAPATVDTFLIAEFDFEGVSGADPQGWTSTDRTAQTGAYWHVDTFNVPAGGGSQAMWCGAQPSGSAPLCGYSCLPGYGNDWRQVLEMPTPIAVAGDATLSFDANWDTEPGYDFVYVEYLDKDANWVQLAALEGSAVDQSPSYVAPASALDGTVRFRLRFVSDGYYSDDDCNYPTDGAIQVDNITIADTVAVVHTEDFEGESAGAQTTDDGVWTATAVPGWGDYAGLFDASTLHLPTSANDTHVWGFTKGSPRTCFDAYNCMAACGPDTLHVVPGRGWNDDDPDLANEIWSPVIDLTTDVDSNPVDPGATQTILEFKVYRNLTLEAGVMYDVHVRSSAGDVECESWLDDGYLGYYGAQGDWYTLVVDVTALVDPAATDLQIALGAYDLSAVLCYAVPECGDCLTQSPLFDDVRVYRCAPTATGADETRQLAYGLDANVPNPFNPTTTIHYRVAERAHVTLAIYNVSGRLVRTLVDGVVSPASVSPVQWHGDDDTGRPVTSGVYFCRLVAGEFETSRKLVLLK